MRCMILAPNLPWPLHGGRQINAHHLLDEMVKHGHEALLVLRDSPTQAQLTTWPLVGRVPVVVMRQEPRFHGHRDGNRASQNQPFVTSLAQESDSNTTDSTKSRHKKSTTIGAARWNRFFGNDRFLASEVARIARDFQPDYVEGCGLETPLWMTQLERDLPKVWLAADEKLLFHGSMLARSGSWRQVCKGLCESLQLARYERWCKKVIDAAVLVAPDDAKMFRKLTGLKDVLVCPNGVDLDFFHPAEKPATPYTAIFWGRLDFAPNIEAVSWFVRRIWPKVVSQEPQARLRVVGRSPGQSLRTLLEQTPGTELVADAPDIRPLVWDSSLVVLPVRSGSGIKNKLLEAAAMGKAIIASPNTVRGCTSVAPPPWVTVQSPDTWVKQIINLWADNLEISRLGERARRWAVERESWHAGWQNRLQWIQQNGRLPGRVTGRVEGARKGLAA